MGSFIFWKSFVWYKEENGLVQNYYEVQVSEEVVVGI